MDNYDYQTMSYAREREFAVAQVLPALMRKVFVWMTLALAITGFTAWAVATTPAIVQAVYGNQAVFWGLIIAEFVLVLAISAGINRLSVGVATLLFILFSVVNGATLSSIFFLYDTGSIASVFFITAGTFAAMAIFGYTTKKDLSTMGRILFMALIGLVIATVVNIFLKSSGLYLILNYVGVLVFVGLTAWDTQKIKQMLMETGGNNELASKVAVLGALSLYLDFINMFIYLLRIFGSSRD